MCDYFFSNLSNRGFQDTMMLGQMWVCFLLRLVHSFLFSSKTAISKIDLPTKALPDVSWLSLREINFSFITEHTHWK